MMDDLDPENTAWKRFWSAAWRGRGPGNGHSVPGGFRRLWPVFAVLKVSKMAVQDIRSLPADPRTMSRLTDGLLRQVLKDSRAGVMHDWVMEYGLAAVGDEPKR